ncbi:cytochrome c3 family protein, partial [Planctomycetota bacterium]|nr:cytochrome c3 family protein [Planctomycetota bacterium]
MECHASIWEEWTNSHHDLAEVPLAEGEVTVDGHPALRSLGVEPLVQYLVMLNGNLQVHQLAQDSETGAWFDVFADGRQEGEWGHWTGRGMNWDTMCAVCHNTGVRRSWDNKTDTFHTEVAEYGVGCEACHGPASEHIDNPKRVLPGAKDGVESCAPCHARRSEFRNHTPGDSFSESFHPALPRHSEAWYADGQILEENFEYGSFVESKMHAAGVTCLDCHNPHTGNLTAEGNALCLSCHSGAGRIPGPVIQVSTHTGHAAESIGSQCVSCHMPTTTYMQRHPRRDHG